MNTPRANRRLAVTAGSGGTLVQYLEPGQARDHRRNSWFETVGLPGGRQLAGAVQEPVCQTQRGVEAASFRVRDLPSLAATDLPPPLYPTAANYMSGMQHAEWEAVGVAASRICSCPA